MLDLRPGWDRLRLPLAYPDPDGPFLGYDEPEVPTMYSSGAPSTRRLVSLACRIATALLARSAGQIACTKAESVELYGRLVGGEWADLVFEIDKHCRAEWSYRIPGDPADQARLRDLCRRLLALERHALERLRV
jgi:hypothetical protein